MPRCAFLAVVLVCCAGVARGGTVAGATGRSVDVPAPLAHVVPAGPPPAILLDAAVTPDLMLGWTSSVPDDARALSEGHAAIVPNTPCGWLDKLPSINRFPGLAWPEDADPRTGAPLFNPVIHGRSLISHQLDTLRAAVHPVKHD
jgi:hypothetical protein